MHKELLKVLVKGSEFSACSLPFTHVSVRHKKPLWLGTAPSKKFRVPPRLVIPDAERIELARLAKNYKSANKAILLYHAALNAKRSATDPEVIKEEKRKEEEDWNQSNFLNDEWNAQVAIEREQRLAIERENKLKEIKMQKAAKEMAEKEALLKAEQEVQAEIEKSKSYITKDNIDEAIEKALSSHIDFNFAIDKKGNVYQGRATNPLNSKEASEDEKRAAQNT